MKLNKKTFMIAGAAAMLTIGAAIPSFAATSGWATEGKQGDQCVEKIRK